VFHALLALVCYALHVRALLGEGLEKWVVAVCFLSASPGMLAASILLERAGVNLRNFATPREKRLARAQLHVLTGSSSLPWVVRLAFAYALLAFLIPVVVPNARGQAMMLPSMSALFHVIPAVVLFHAFRYLGRKSPGPSAPIPSR